MSNRFKEIGSGNKKITFDLIGCKNLTRERFDKRFGNETVNAKGNGYYKQQGEIGRVRLNQVDLDRTWKTLQKEIELYKGGGKPTTKPAKSKKEE